MSAITEVSRDGLRGDPDAVIRRLYSLYAKPLQGYVGPFCPDPASADDIVQETFLRAWRHLPELSTDDRPVRPWLFRVAQPADRRNRAARGPADDRARAASRGSGSIPGLRRSWTGSSFPPRSSTCRPHQSVLVEPFYPTLRETATQARSGRKNGFKTYGA
jgi:hypothetical protein